MIDVTTSKIDLRRAAIHAGGFVGPFLGQSLAVILPEFAASYGITLNQAASTITAYMIPFALAMLGSTHLVRNLSPSKVVLRAFVIIFLGALVLTVAPSWWVFLAAFMVMAVCNAFTTPVLQVLIKRTTPDGQLGRELGTFVAIQSLGVFSAPLIAGAAAKYSWRLTYLLVAVVCAFILIVRLPECRAAETTGTGAKQRFSLAHTSVHMATCLAIGMGVAGMPFAVALLVGDRFGADSVAKGLVVMCGGLAAFLFSRAIGTFADRAGHAKVLLMGLAESACGLAMVPFVPALGLVGVVWGLTLIGSQAVQAMVTVIVLRSPGGTSLLSSVLAFRFFGSALAPILMLHVYQRSAQAAFLIPAVILLLVFTAEGVIARRKVLA